MKEGNRVGRKEGRKKERKERRERDIKREKIFKRDTYKDKISSKNRNWTENDKLNECSRIKKKKKTSESGCNAKEIFPRDFNGMSTYLGLFYVRLY